jgi:hypothetical protein
MVCDAGGLSVDCQTNVYKTWNSSIKLAIRRMSHGQNWYDKRHQQKHGLSPVLAKHPFLIGHFVSNFLRGSAVSDDADRVA